MTASCVTATAIGITILAALAAAAPSAAMAGERFATDYSISFSGLPVARSSFTTTVEGDTLTLSGNLSSAGLVSVFASTKASSTIVARVTEKGLQTQSYQLNVRYGDSKRETKVRFKGGDVANVSITPTRKPRAGAVPVEDGHLKRVIDPFLASVIRASSPSEVCNRTIRVFDGVTRSDLVLRPDGAEPFKTKGFDGEGVRCAVRYVPVSGHRANSKSTRFMAEGERARITFAAFPGSEFYAPVKASVETRNGKITVRATRFETAAP
jgi:Protein of unknown function (DUF3108)